MAATTHVLDHGQAGTASALVGGGTVTPPAHGARAASVISMSDMKRGKVAIDDGWRPVVPSYQPAQGYEPAVPSDQPAEE